MEADRSIGGRTKRKPLADCTNTVSRSSQSSSSSATLIKSTNPGLSSSLKRIIDDVRLKERTRVTDRSNFGAGNASGSQIVGVTNSSSAGSPATSPPWSRNTRSAPGVGGKEIAEPHSHSVYTRRKTPSKTKNKEKFVSEPVDYLLKDSISGSREKTHQANTNVTKPLKAPRQKRQRRVKLPQDYIEQQRAYFNEIDAFELPVEEVTSMDDLE